MSTLKLAECQLVEIVKAVTQSVRLVVLDEPTSSLSRPESQILFRVLQRLTRQGIGIVYISHRIDEVFQCGHRIDVLRNGELVASLSTSETSQSQVIAHMLGREGLALKSPRDRSGGSTTPVIRLVNWSSGGRPRLSGVDISVSRGEIVGLFGLRGCGAGAVAEGLIGLRPDVEGDFYFEGEKRDIFSSPREAREAKLIYLPPERKRDGLVMTLSVYANMTLSILDRLSRIGVIKGKAEKSFARRLVNRLNVRCKSIEQALTDLSGGNQQKVLLARCLAAQPSALVLREPTRGVDVGARAEVHEIVRDVSNQGTAILWVTSDAEEATTVSDRLLVMREGAVVAELSGSSMSQQSALGIAEAEVD
jgi:ABC-type sugar transport system ATPase subunit